jgi:hypothetical protein
MHKNSHRTWQLPRALGVATALIIIQAPAQAHLGGDAASVDDDSVKLRGQVARAQMLQYDRHDISSGGDAIVHEYLSRSGKVFAVTWQGPVQPNLQQLFGDYFETFRAAAATPGQPGLHRQARLVRPDFVYEAAGHLRSFRGRAYVPSLVPAGVDIASLP